MYSFEPTEEQQMLIEAVGKYAAMICASAAHEAEESRELPKKAYQQGLGIGLLQASVPESYGGFGERSAVTGVLALEEMAFGDLAGTLAVLTPVFLRRQSCWRAVKSKSKRYLPKVIESGLESLYCRSHRVHF